MLQIDSASAVVCSNRLPDEMSGGSLKPKTDRSSWRGFRFGYMVQARDVFRTSVEERTTASLRGGQNWSAEGYSWNEWRLYGRKRKPCSAGVEEGGGWMRLFRSERALREAGVCERSNPDSHIPTQPAQTCSPEARTPPGFKAWNSFRAHRARPCTRLDVHSYRLEGTIRRQTSLVMNPWANLDLRSEVSYQ